jgi:hypothetical protein
MVLTMTQLATRLKDLSDRKRSIYQIVCGFAASWGGVSATVAVVVLQVAGLLIQSHLSNTDGPKISRRKVALITGLGVAGLVLGAVGLLKILGAQFILLSCI